MKPITWKQYHKYPLDWWMKQRVRTLIPIECDYWKADTGVEVKIIGKYNGFDIEYDRPCASCGITKRLTMRGIRPECLEIIVPEQTEIISPK